MRKSESTTRVPWWRRWSRRIGTLLAGAAVTVFTGVIDVGLDRAADVVLARPCTAVTAPAETAQPAPV